MYWGEIHVHLATSPDLIHWTPVEDSAGQPVELLSARPGHFDSSFPETGPPPVLTEKGIMLIYNGKNAPDAGDPALGPNAYAAGQALFAADNPAKLIARDEKPFFFPEMSLRENRTICGGDDLRRGAGLVQEEVVSLLRMRGFFGGCSDFRP